MIKYSSLTPVGEGYYTWEVKLIQFSIGMLQSDVDLFDLLEMTRVSCAIALGRMEKRIAQSGRRRS